MKLGSMLMKINVLFNGSNSLQTSEAKHTNDRAAKFSFLDHKELSRSEEVIPSGDGLCSETSVHLFLLLH